VHDEFDVLQAGEVEFSLDLVDDAVTLCENIRKLRDSNHTSDMWSNGKAVQEVYMKSFGQREGLTSVFWSSWISPVLK